MHVGVIWMTHEYGLSGATVKAIRGVFSLFPQVGQVLLYGSRAKGNYRTGSDIDLSIVADDGSVVDLDVVFAIDNALDDLMLPYTFDLSVLADLDNPQLVDHIKRVGVEFYRKG